MSQPLSASARRVQDALTAQGLTVTVRELTDSTRTAQEAAASVGCELGQIVKSLIFRGLETDRAILVVTSGANRVDEHRLAQLAGEAIGRADASFVRERTGFVIGGVAPIGHRSEPKTFFDEDLLQFDTLWAAAGTPNALFATTPADLRAMTQGEDVRVKP